MELILTIAGLIVVLIAVVLLRAMLLKPTTAKDAKIIGIHILYSLFNNYFL